MAMATLVYGAMDHYRGNPKRMHNATTYPAEMIAQGRFLSHWLVTAHTTP
jgi:hypothetical protein